MNGKPMHKEVLPRVMDIIRESYAHIHRREGPVGAANSLASHRSAFGSVEFQRAADLLIEEWRQEERRSTEDTSAKWLELLTGEQK